MPSFTIRPATHEDAQRLAHIGAATFIESYSEQIDGAAMIDHCTHQHSKSVYEHYLNAPKAKCWLAEHEKTGAPIGYAVNCAPDLPVSLQPHDVELKRIYVLSKYHGQGAAAALLSASEIHAIAQNASRLLLGTYEKNYRAMAFYTKHGFKPIGTRKFHVGGQTYDDIVMAKTL